MQRVGQEVAGGLRQRISAHVIARITDGTWKAGDQIPSESAFGEMFGASRMTVHHALRELSARGYLVRRSGLGTFIAAPRPYIAEYAHQDVIEEIRERGGTHEARVLRRELIAAAEEEAAEFELAHGTQLFHAVILHLENGVPLELERRFVNPEALPDCMAIDLGHQTIFSRLMLTRPYREGSEAVRAVLPTIEQRQLLGIEKGVPVLEVARRTWSSEGVVTIARMIRAGQHGVMRGRIRSAPNEVGNASG